MPELDQDLELRDLGKNTANEIPRRETDGIEENLLDFELAALDELVELAALVNEETSKTKTKNNQDTLSDKCNQCYYALSQASHLKEHLKAHCGEKSNKCNQCNYAYSWVSHMKEHLKTHSGEKANKCNQCDFASYELSGLKKHLKTHTGARLKKCN